MRKSITQRFCNAIFLSLFFFGGFDVLGQLCVAYGNGTFVATGNHRTILISKDGTNWLNRSVTVTNTIVGINFTTQNYTVDGDSLTLVIPIDASSKMDVQQSGFRHLAFPNDGAIADMVQFRSRFAAIRFGNNMFVILGGSGEILISPDGEFWRSVNAPISASFTGIVWGGDKYVAVGDAGIVLTSTDGVKWTSRNSGTDKNLQSVAFGNGVFVAVGGNQDNSVILTSSDGISWTPSMGNYGCAIVTILFGKHGFVASGGENQFIMASSDGKAWKGIARVPDGYSFTDGSYGHGVYLTGTAHGRGIYVSVGNSFLKTSSDEVHWSPVKPPSGKMLLSGRIVHGPYFVNGDIPKFGNVFEAEPSPVGAPIVLVPESQHDQVWITYKEIPIRGNVFGNETYFMTSKASETFAVLTSDDGITWTQLHPAAAKTNLVTVTNLTAPAATSVGIAFQLNGQSYNLNLSAKVGVAYELQASTDLEYWINLTTMTNNGEMFNYMDHDVTKYPQRFYRLMELQQ